MKQLTGYVILLVSLLLLPLFSMAAADDMHPDNLPIMSEKSDNPLLINFFYDISCESCQKVIPLVQDYNTSNPDVLVNFINIGFSPSNFTLFNEFRDQYQVSDNHIPMVFFGDTWLSGDENITKNFNTTVQSALQKQKLSTAHSGSAIVADLFYNPDCSPCQKILPYLSIVSSQYPDLRIQYHNVGGDESGMVLLNEFQRNYGLSQTSVPVVFIGGTVLQNDDNITRDLEPTIRILQNQNSLNGLFPDKNLVRDNYPLYLLFAALGEWLNTSVLLVISGFFVTLRNQSSRRRMISTGLACILAFLFVRIFIGMGALSALQALGLSQIFVLIAAVIALVFGIVHIRDGFTRRENALLSLPQNERTEIDRYMKKTTLPAGIMIGIFLGVFGLISSGGLYLPVIGVVSVFGQSGILSLIIYNCVVGIPLILTCLLISGGYAPQRIEKLLQNNKFLFWICMGFVMEIIGIITILSRLV